MSYFYGLSSDSVSTLFSSLGTNSSTGNSNILAEYASIRNGSYYKLAKAYYSKLEKENRTSEASDKDKQTTPISMTTSEKARAKALNEVKSNADSLAESLEPLVGKGADSVFKKVSRTDSENNTSEVYDVNKIYNAVSEFADKYNAVYETAGGSSISSINSSANTMYNFTKANEKLLSEVGITLDKENKLKVDEETFKNADMKKVESLFSGNGSYGYNLKASATYASISATNAANQSGLYGSTGKYTALNQTSAFEGLF